MKVPEILFEGDLIRSVAKELSMDEKKVEHHLVFLKRFLLDTIKRDDVHSFRFPHLGTMYRNIKGCAHSNIYIEKREIVEKKQAVYDKNTKDIAFILDELKSFQNKSLHNAKRRIHNPYFTCTKSWEELENFQNNGKKDR